MNCFKSYLNRREITRSKEFKSQAIIHQPAQRSSCSSIMFLLYMRRVFIIKSQDDAQNYNRLPWLVKIILYYEVPQNALCSLCLHCLNTGSKKTQEGFTLQQRSKPPEIRCVRYRYTAVKTSQSKGFFTNPLAINDYLGYRHSLTWKYKKEERSSQYKVFNSSLPEFQLVSLCYFL